jgi:hypothetical protein
MLELGGAAAPVGNGLDGISLQAMLRGGETFECPLYWRMNRRNQRAYC